MNEQTSFFFKKYLLIFSEFYYQYRMEREQFKNIKYRIISSLEYFKETGKIELAHTDKPGDVLPALTISEIKTKLDLLSGMHPIDVNSINDLFYLSQDKIAEMRIAEDHIQATDILGKTTHYEIYKVWEDPTVLPKRIAFLIGYMQAEKRMKELFNIKQEKYKILQDNITALQILNLKTKQKFLKTPAEILFSNDYMYYSKEDIMKIGFICGQMSKI